MILNFKYFENNRYIVIMSNNYYDDSKEKFEEKITNSIQGILRLTILVNI